MVPTASRPGAPICTDRPTRSNFACTVSAGKVQIERDAVNRAFTRQDGARSDTLLFTNPTLKYGLGDATDMQLNWTPCVRVRSRDARGAIAVTDGTGDVVLRLNRGTTDAQLYLGLSTRF